MSLLFPAQQELPHDNSDSLDFDATLDLDQENSFSGGEGSNTAESSSEDQEFGLTDLSQDDGLDQISEISMERRDSGVGHSLTRSSRYYNYAVSFRFTFVLLSLSLAVLLSDTGCNETAAFWSVAFIYFRAVSSSHSQHSNNYGL